MVTEDELRRLALSLPAVTERPSYGTPAFFVGKAPFARLNPAVAMQDDDYDETPGLSVIKL